MQTKIYLLFLLLPFLSYGQQVKISAAPDRSEMKIGEQIHYKIAVEADSTARVSFPDAQQFAPFEVVSQTPVDTFKERDRFRLIKEYALTQFDSGHYTLPSLRIGVNKDQYQTDSLSFVVHDVVLDTLKQPLYPIKPAIEVKKAKSDSSFWYWIVGGIVFLTVLFSLYWFFIRKKKGLQLDTEAALPPFDRALLKLKNLQNSRYLLESNHKEYYSVLTDIIRKYLEEEIHITATESTTDELLAKLQVFLDAGKLHLSSQVMDELRTVLKKADLVKFAKSKPEDYEAESDRKAIESIVVKTNEGLPDMTQEEDMQDEYQRIRLEKQRKSKRRKYIITLSAAVVLLFALLAGTWYAFTIGKEKTFNTEHWVTSSYGYPAITLSTPEVLKREKKANELDRFTYITSDSPISIMLITNSLKEYLSEFYIGQEGEASQERTQEELNELVLRMIEKELKKYFKGENILIKDDTYTTAQGVAGHKVFGSFTQKEKEVRKMRYQSYFFIRGEAIQMILFTYPEDEKTVSSSLVEKIMTTVKM